MDDSTLDHGAARDAAVVVRIRPVIVGADVELRRKLSILADAAKYDASCASSGVKRSGSASGLGNADGTGICHSYTPDGRCVSLLKILLSNVCVYDCSYCINRVSSDVVRASFTVDEVVSLTLEFYRRSYIEGLFLSSGVFGSGDETMTRMVEVARRLRRDHDFRGYIHLKVVPGVSAELLAAAGRLADRLSANIELPTQRDLETLAPAKSVAEIEGTMRVIRRERDEATDERAGSRHAPTFAPAGQSTQMIVGATPSTDADVLGTADRLYRRHALRRVYFSSYSPIEGASPGMPARAPALAREHRLYQADWLLRFYGFTVDELVDASRPFLSERVDPKLDWALRHPEAFPVDVNTAEPRAILRVPGLGTRSTKRIVAARRHHRLAFADLGKLGVELRRAAGFVIASDRVPQPLDLRRLAEHLAPDPQLSLFDRSS